MKQNFLKFKYDHVYTQTELMKGIIPWKNYIALKL